jgi:hypothetical protein
MDPKIDAEPLLGPEPSQPPQPSPQLPPPNTTHNHPSDFDFVVHDVMDPLPLRAEAQQPEYRDAPFAVAFVLHLVLVLSLAARWGWQALRWNHNLSGLLWLCGGTSLIGMSLAAGSLRLVSYHAETLIQGSLIVSACFMATSVVAFWGDGLTMMGVVWSVMLLLTVLYARAVWHRIPFAAANLRTALSAVETNAGVCVLAYAVALVANVWVVLWCMAFVGVAFRESNCNSDGDCLDNSSSHMHAISIVLLVLSFHWTSQVLKNVLHVTVSGVVGTWWFAPQDCLSVWSPAIVDSFSRATTYSFGSICMGR